MKKHFLKIFWLNVLFMLVDYKFQYLLPDGCACSLIKMARGHLMLKTKVHDIVLNLWVRQFWATCGYIRSCSWSSNVVTIHITVWPSDRSVWAKP